MNNIHNQHEPPDFSLVLGGPLFQLLVRSRLATPGLGLINRRIVFISMFAWLPLLILSLVNGRALGGAGMPFLYDIEMHARFLVALPLRIRGRDGSPCRAVALDGDIAPLARMMEEMRFTICDWRFTIADWGLGIGD